MKYLCSVCAMIDDGVTKQVLALRICSSKLFLGNPVGLEFSNMEMVHWDI